MATKRTKRTERRCPAWFVVVTIDSQPSIYRCDSLPADDDAMGQYVRGINGRRRAKYPDPDVEFAVWMVGHVDWDAQFERLQVESFDCGTWDSVEDIPELFRMPWDMRDDDDDSITDADWDWAGKVVKRCVLRWEKVDRIDGSVEGVSFVSR